MLGLGLMLCATQACLAQVPCRRAETRDPAVLARLAQMGDYLRSLKSFTVKADTAKDEVLESGQKVQFGGTLEYRYATPDKLRASIRTDRKWRDFYFDGKTLTQVAPRMGYYGSVQLPGKVGEVMTGLAQRYDIDMPLADLFYWGTPSSGVDDVTAATLIGPARIGGIETDHFALRQAGVDWQIWIERGARPLPRKLVITTTEEPAQPQYSATLKLGPGRADACSGVHLCPAQGCPPHRADARGQDQLNESRRHEPDFKHLPSTAAAAARAPACWPVRWPPWCSPRCQATRWPAGR